jgi:hypothetical protein
MEMLDSRHETSPDNYAKLLLRLKDAGVGLDLKFGFRLLDTYMWLAYKSQIAEEACKGADLVRKAIYVSGPDDLKGLNEFGKWTPISREDYLIVMSHVDRILQRAQN